MSINYGLAGKTAVVTGGTGVLCREIVNEFVNQGVKVAILGHSGDKAKKMSEELNLLGGETIAYNVNVLNKDELIEARNFVLSNFGTIDILVNGAGGNKKEATTSDDLSFFSLDHDAMSWVVDLNLLGTVLPTQVFGEAMSKNSSGVVINISSMAAFHPLTKTIAYSAAKAAVSNFTEWMAVYFNQNHSPNIRVNAVAPGFLLTTQNEFLLVNEDGSSTERGSKIINKTPMGRYGQPNEIAKPIMWLCSEDAKFVTGIVLPIDGGFSAYWGV